MLEGIKGFLKKGLPPTTAMLDRRIDRLIEDNRALQSELGRLSNELSSMWRQLVSMRADGLRAQMRISSLSPLYGSPDLIVSVASYGPRIDCIVPMIESVGNQTVRPDRAFLWMPSRDFPRGVDDLPSDVVCALNDANIEPRFVEMDLGPHNKYFWTMRAFPESVVVTLDDDVCYPSDLLESLLAARRSNPGQIVAMRVRRILPGGEENLSPYETWPLDPGDLLGKPSFRLIATGVGGVLYPSHCLDDHVFDADGIRKTCLRADDLWLKVMAVLAGTRTVCPVTDCPLCYCPGTQETALCEANLYRGENDSQLEAILEYVSTFANVQDILHKMLGEY